MERDNAQTRHELDRSRIQNLNEENIQKERMVSSLMREFFNMRMALLDERLQILLSHLINCLKENLEERKRNFIKLDVNILRVFEIIDFFINTEANRSYDNPEADLKQIEELICNLKEMLNKYPKLESLKKESDVVEFFSFLASSKELAETDDSPSAMTNVENPIFEEIIIPRKNITAEEPSHISNSFERSNSSVILDTAAQVHTGELQVRGGSYYSVSHLADPSEIPASVSTAAKISSDNSLLEALKKFYASRKMLQRIFYSSPLPVESLFVSLSIVKREEQKLKEAKMEIEANAAGSAFENLEAINPEQALYVNTYQRIYASKAPILLDAIFTPEKEDNKLPRRALLLGSAGIGKTTLCQYITYRWSSGKLWAGDASQNGFHWVFHIPLRRLLSYHYQEGQRLRTEFIGQDANLLLAKIIHHEVYEDSASLSIETIRTILEAGRAESLSQRVLLLLDGWDEVNEHYHNPQSPYQDMLKKIVAYPDILMTSRPAGAFGLNIDRQIECIGFSDEQIPLYLEKFFSTLSPSELKEKTPDESITSLKHFFKQNPNVKGMAHIPLQLEMIASLWNDSSKEQVLTTPISLSQLLGEMCTKLWRRYQKRGKVTGKATLYSEVDLLKPLSQLAYEHFILDSRQLIIPTAQMKRFYEQFFSCYNDILMLGILRATKESEFMEDNDYYFIQLTFKEYLAALYWVGLFCSERVAEKEQAEEFLRKNKYELRYEIFWGFAAGLLKKQIEASPLFTTRLNAFFKILEEDPQDLIGARHMAVLIRCLEECKCPKVLFNRENLIKSIEKWFSQEATRCINEGYLRIVLSYSKAVVNAVQMAWFEHAESAFSQRNDQEIDYWLLFLGECTTDNARLGELWLSLVNQESCLRRDSYALKKVMTNIKLNEAQWKKAIISLAASIQSTDDEVRDSAATILQSLCSLLLPETQVLFMSQLISCMHSKDFEIRDSVARILQSLYSLLPQETQAQFIAQLMPCMQSEDFGIRISAAEILQSLYSLLPQETQQAQFIAQLIPCMQSEDFGIRISTAKILQFLWPLLTPGTQAPFISQLLPCMQSEDFGIRISAAKILQSLYSLLPQETQAPFISQLIPCMQSKDFGIRISAAEILQPLYSLLPQETQAPFISQLMSCMQSENFGIRISAAEILQSLYSLLPQETQAPFISQLMPCMQSKDFGIRISAAEILQSLYSLLPQETQVPFISQLMPCIQSEDFGIRISAAKILQSLCPLFKMEQIKSFFDVILVASEDSHKFIGFIEYLDLTEYIKKYPDRAKEVVILMQDNNNFFSKSRALTNLCSRYLLTTTAEEKQKFQTSKSLRMSISFK